MLRRSVIALFVLSSTAVLASPVVSDEFLPPVVVLRKLPPGVDASSAAAYLRKQPVSIPRFEYFEFDYLPSQQTDVRLAYDDSNLYIAYHCLEEQMAKMVTKETKRDSPVWKEDSVWAMLDVHHNHKNYYNLVSSAAGVQFDEKDYREMPDSWEGKWSVETRKGSDSWTVVMTVPFSTLGVSAPKPGTVWGANFVRISRPFGERSCWTTINRATRQPERWGDLVFAGPDAVSVSVVPNTSHRDNEFAPCRDRAAGTCSAPATPISVPGHHPLTLHVSNPTARPVALTVETIIDDKVTEKQSASAGSGETEVNLRYEMPFEGEHQLKFAVRDGRTGECLMRTAATLVYIHQHQARIAYLRKLANELRPNTAAARDEKSAVMRMLNDLTVRTRQSIGDEVKWHDLGERIRTTESAVGHLRCVCADRGGLGYALGTDLSMHKILRDEMFEGKFGSPLQISAARSEFESGQVAVLAYEKALKNVSVSVTPLVGPDGATIPADRIQLNLVDFVKTGPPRYAVEYIGWIPDPLMDMRPFDLQLGGIRPIWITVHTAENTPAGLYKGKVVVKPENAPESSVPVEVHVWGFTLPVRPALKTAFALFDYEIRAWYGKYTPEMRREWYEFLLDHRINPTNIYSKQPVPAREDLPFCVQHGLNAFALTCTWYKDGDALKKLLAMINDNEQYLKKHGWEDLPYVYGFDELGPNKYEELKSTYGAIKKEFPGLPTMTTVVPNKYLKGAVDIWVPLTANWNAKDAEEYTKDGDQVWWYVCCHPFHPYPNFFIDYPGVDPRILFWMNWKFKVPGVLYYAINIWKHNRVAEAPNIHEHPDLEARKAIAAGKRWPEVPWNTFSCATWNGDGQLVYPGPDGRPLSSIRLECIRDGIEDYEYFNQLNLLVQRLEKDPRTDPNLLAKARKVLAVSDDVVRSPKDYTLDAELLLRARQEVAETIEKGYKVLGL